MVFMGRVWSCEFGESWVQNSSTEGKIQLGILYIALAKDRVKIKGGKVKKLAPGE